MDKPVLDFRSHSLAKYVNEYIVQGDYGQGWEDVKTELTWNDGVRSLREYDRNESDRPHRVITRRVPNPDHGRFHEGQYVAVHPALAVWMRGFGYGTVVAIGHRYVTVAWSMNPSMKRKFTTANIAPGDGS